MNRAARLRSDFALYGTLFTVIGLLDGVQSYASAGAAGHPVTMGFALGTGLLNWWSCGLLTPMYIWLVRRVPLVRPHLPAKVLLYAVILVFSVVPKYAIWIPLENAIFGTHWTFAKTVIDEVFGVFIGQLSFVVLLYAMEYYRIARARELQATQLEAQLSHAQLDALRAQIHPHFLFNTLNSISALMQRDVSAAQRMLERLSDMLRLTLASDGSQEARLDSEIRMLEAYLEIMRARFGDRLAANVDVDAALLGERVPSFVLQPLVENTVRHGLNESSKTTNVRITAATQDDMLVL